MPLFFQNVTNCRQNGSWAAQNTQQALHFVLYKYVKKRPLYKTTQSYRCDFFVIIDFPISFSVFQCSHIIVSCDLWYFLGYNTYSIDLL